MNYENRMQTSRRYRMFMQICFVYDNLRLLIQKLAAAAKTKNTRVSYIAN